VAARRDPAETAEPLVALARSLAGGDPLRDEPAAVFAPLGEPAEPEASEAEPR